MVNNPATSTTAGSHRSLRAIAREVGLNPASLYTYFDSLEDLFTALLLQSFERLGDVVSATWAASNALPAVERVVACVDAYRDWAVAHPAQFNLLFTNAIPGYVAPEAAGTREAEFAIWAPLLASTGEVVGRDLSALMRGEQAQEELSAAVLAVFATMHGFVTLEVNHHLPADLDVGAVLHTQIRAALDRLANSVRD